MKVSDIIHIFKSFFVYVSFLMIQFQPISSGSNGILEVMCPWNHVVCVVFSK